MFVNLFRYFNFKNINIYDKKTEQFIFHIINLENKFKSTNYYVEIIYLCKICPNNFF